MAADVLKSGSDEFLGLIHIVGYSQAVLISLKLY
jgi:hypothetical protein